MAASNLNNVIGFYLMLNSNDYPNNYSPNLPFGFGSTDKSTFLLLENLNR